MCKKNMNLVTWFEYLKKICLRVHCTNLVGFVEEETEVRENHPQLLPAITVLELPQQIATQLILKINSDIKL